MYHRRWQTRAAGTTNRLVGKDPRSQPSVSSRQSRKDRGLHSGTPVGSATPCHLPTSHLPPHCRTKDCFPAPALQPLERKQEMPRVAFPSAWSASCTSFEKSSLLSSPVPPPTHDMASLSVDLGSSRPKLFTWRHRPEGESRSSQQASSNETSRLSAVDMAAFEGPI